MSDIDRRYQRPFEIVPKSVFIVYQSREELVAKTLCVLLKHWELSPYYCRQEDVKSDASKVFREILASKLIKSEIVIFLLSREFQWAEYCQAEAGATMAADIPRLLIKIPPVESKDVATICPVLDGFNTVTIDDYFCNNLAKNVDEKLKESSVTELRKAFSAEKQNRERELSDEVKEQIDAAKQYYAYNYPQKIEKMGVWSSLEDDTARASIVGNIRRSIVRPDRIETRLTFVGVSLKFSLNLIDQVLHDMADPECVTPGSALPVNKKLTIELVHMDDCSHILHTLNDTIDILNIRENFRRSWNETVTKWKQYCQLAKIELNLLPLVPIDYIPPRVGILIDDDYLYAGRCSVARKGSAYHLLVGEKEYYFYTKNGKDSRGRQRIREFENFVKTYKDYRHNGAWLVGDEERTGWLYELQQSLRSFSSAEATELTLISRTGLKFLPLIRTALRRGWMVKLFVERPDDSGIKALRRSLAHELRVLSRLEYKPVIVYYYNQQSTFRAAIIGNHLMGLQMYVDLPFEKSQSDLDSIDSKPIINSLQNSPIRMTFGSNSPHFDELTSMIDQFVGQDPEHGFTIP